MGYANSLIEQQVGGISLFINADAGDIDPGPLCIFLEYEFCKFKLTN